jgi:predicted RNA-binding Zn ribbon-like protein
MTPLPPSTTLPLRVGGRPVLDFLNTLEARSDPDPQEFLPDYATFLTWVDALDLPLPTPVGTLRAIADGDPQLASSTHRQVRELRESLSAVFASAAARSPVPDGDLGRVNAALCEATDHHVLRPDPAGGVRDGWLGKDRLDSPLWLLVIDAWDLLTTDQLQRVRECPGDRCGWLFLDESRAGNRRWCDMRTCGNRAKVRTHYSRRHPDDPT